MIDYFGHLAVLDELHALLQLGTYSHPDENKAQARTLAALAQDGDLARLGTLIDHLLAHASSDGSELAMLETAAGLWRDGLAIYNDISAARAALQSSLTDPGAPDAVAKFQQANALLSGMEQRTTEVVNAAMALPAQFSPPRFLTHHPRQEDRKTPDWNWGDLFLARRTDAFVRNLAAAAGQDSAARAFAFGALAGYGGNVAGSAYQSRTVGGPRRAHPYRDRLAKYASGGWLREHRPGLPPLKKLAQMLRWGVPALPPQLPSQIAQLLNDTLSATYDLRVTAPLPDVQLGYQRLQRHIELLGAFEMPPLPAPATGTLPPMAGGVPSGAPGNVPPPSPVPSPAQIPSATASVTGPSATNVPPPTRVPTTPPAAATPNQMPPAGGPAGGTLTR